MISRHGPVGAALVGLAVTLSGTTATRAGPVLDLAAADLIPAIARINPKGAFGVSILIGLVIFALVLAVLHIRERQAWATREGALRAEIAILRDATERADVLIGSEPQLVVTWNGRDDTPAMHGDTAVIGGGEPGRALAFGSWLGPGDAARISARVESLRERGESFALTLRTNALGFIEARGLTVGSRALLRLRDVTGIQSDMLRVEQDAAEARKSLGAFRDLLDSIDEPIWLRRSDGRLSFANRAYCRAVETTSSEEAVGRSLELMDHGDRREAARKLGSGEPFHARVAAIVGGLRRVLDITEASLPEGSGGIAQDVSELESVRSDLQRQMQAHVRTLDQVPTAVAMFDAGQTLTFHNAAYRQLWDLDAAFLAGKPSDGEILDRLRSMSRLPEQADYWGWKAGVQASYGASEPQETWWHLPDRRTLRVVATPTPKGGLTYLFDDVSDRIHLESRYNSLARVQTETLDTLLEGVALFGTDGRLKLVNRAFAQMWQLDRDALGGEPHIGQIVELCRGLAPGEGWDELTATIFGLSDTRLRATARMERLDGSVLECAAEPLPDGATLLTFVDVTASVNVERALTERNEALELAGRLRNEFVHHVSYELRSPLTTVIGFSEMLGAGTAGPLNARQREYADHIARASGALLTIIDDILDLASIDTDTIDLSSESVDIRETIEMAAKGIEGRLVEARLRLDIDAPASIGSFTADPKRLRQILFNLLSNAAAFSSAGQTIRVVARKTAGEVLLCVADEGCGIPDEVKARVFDRFESHPLGTSHRGVGLGLSIVRSFVELHGGHVELVSEPGTGTVVSCHFPTDGKPSHRAAAE